MSQSQTVCGFCSKPNENDTQSNLNCSHIVTLACGHKFHRDCLNKFILFPIRIMCPTCKTPFRNYIIDIYQFLRKNTKNKFINIDIKNNTFKTKNLPNNYTSITLDGDTFIDPIGQMTNSIAIDAINTNYSRSSSELTINLISIINMCILKNNTTCVHLDDYARFLLILENNKANSLIKEEDAVGNTYYTTYDEYKCRKYIKHITIQQAIILESLNIIFDLPFCLNTDPMDPYKETDTNNPLERKYNEIGCVITDLSVFTISKYIEKCNSILIDYLAKLSDDKFAKLFCIASIYNVFNLLGYTKFKIVPDLVEKISGFLPDGVTIDINIMPNGVKEFYQGKLEVGLDSEFIRPYIDVTDKEFEFVSEIIRFQHESGLIQNYEVI